MLYGTLQSRGIRIGKTKVGTAGRSLNPRVYHADYFGHKIHFDQNEKLGMFGIVHVCARDGYSGMIVGHSTMFKKNNIIIYNDILR